MLNANQIKQYIVVLKTKSNGYNMYRLKEDGKSSWKVQRVHSPSARDLVAQLQQMGVRRNVVARFAKEDLIITLGKEAGVFIQFCPGTLKGELAYVARRAAVSHEVWEREYAEHEKKLMDVKQGKHRINPSSKVMWRVKWEWMKVCVLGKNSYVPGMYGQLTGQFTEATAMKKRDKKSASLNALTDGAARVYIEPVYMGTRI